MRAIKDQNPGSQKVKIACVVVILAAITTAVLFRIGLNGGTQASTAGSNSAAVNMSAATSGTNSPLVQAAPGATAGNGNVSMSASLSGANSTLIQANNSTVNNVNLNGPSIVVIGTQNPIQVKPLPFRQKNGDVSVRIGAGMSIILPPVPSNVWATKDLGRDFIGAGTNEYPSHMILVAYGSQLYLNIKFAPIYGMPALELTNNELSGLPDNWDCNHSDKGIEIVNEKQTPIFQMYYKDDAHIVINGAFTFVNHGIKGCVFDSEETAEVIEFGGDYAPDEFFKKVEALKMQRLFKYPAWRHPGEYAD